MKEFEVAQRFANAFAADATFSGRGCINDHGIVDLTRPCLIFQAANRPMNSSGSAMEFKLTVWIETEYVAEAAPASATVHAAAVEAVRQKLHGTGRAALRTAVSGTGFDFRDWSAVEPEPGIQTQHFRDGLSIAGVFLLT